MIDERIKKKVLITETILQGDLDKVLSTIKSERRSGQLILVFNCGTEVLKKFERIEKST